MWFEQTNGIINPSSTANMTDLSLDQEVFVRDDSSLYKELRNVRFKTRLTNQTNQQAIY